MFRFGQRKSKSNSKPIEGRMPSARAGETTATRNEADQPGLEKGFSDSFLDLSHSAMHG